MKHFFVVGLLAFSSVSYSDFKRMNLSFSNAVKFIKTNCPQFIIDSFDDKIYFANQYITPTSSGIILKDSDVTIYLPKNYVGFQQHYFFCKNKQSKEDNSRSREVEDHYDRAKDALVEAIGHSMAAGLSVEVPPLAIYEGYKAVEAWIEVGREYSEGARLEDTEKEKNEISQRDSND